MSAVYQTPQSLGFRAFTKAKKALPSSPRKQKIIVSKLAQEVGTKIHRKSLGNKKLPDATIGCVSKYFLLDSVSHQAPGIKDYVTIRSAGKKTKLQKRHLTCSLKEAFYLFKIDHPTVKISLSKFCSLRPPNVMLSSMMPRNVCPCQHHNNIKLLCEAIHKAVPDFSHYSNEAVNNFVCSAKEEKCMSSICPNWAEELRSIAPLEEPVEWHQWERKVYPGKKGKSPKIKKIEKVVKSASVDEIITALEEKIPAFLNHVFVKKKQSRFFEDKKSTLSFDEVIVQVDCRKLHMSVSK